MDTGFSFQAMAGTKPVAFTIDTQRDDDGKPRSFTHHLRILSGLETIELADSLSIAKLGLDGDVERARAGVETFAAAWDRLVDHPDARVEGYTAEVLALRGPELVAYFRGDTLPDDLAPARRAQIVAAMQEHKALAVSAYLREKPLEDDFRDEAT